MDIFHKGNGTADPVIEMESVVTDQNHTIRDDKKQETQGDGAGVTKVERGESIPLLFVAIQTSDPEQVSKLAAEHPELVNQSYKGLTPLHATCLAKNLDILNVLLDCGAKVEPFDSLGNTALHLAVNGSWYEGVERLLQSGASPNDLSGPTFATTNARIETPLHTAVRQRDVTSTEMLLKHEADLSIKDSDNCYAVHLAASLHTAEVLQLLLNDVNYTTDLKCESLTYKTGFLAALSNCEGVDESIILKTLETLCSANHDLNTVNQQGEGPLFLACRSGLPKVVKFLLSKGADPMVTTNNDQSTLHSSCQSGCSSALQMLLNTGLVNNLICKKDSDCNTPFYFAVQSRSIECCEILLQNGAHLTDINSENYSNCSLILEKLPSALQLLRKTFDESLKVSEKNEWDPDFSITFNYSSLVSSESGNIQSSIVSEIIGSPLESLIKHPLLESFLYIKWSRINSFFYCYVLQFAIYNLIHTSFIFMTFGQTPTDWSKNEILLTTYRCLHLVLLLIILVPDSIIMFGNYRKYLFQCETYSKLIALISSVILVFMPNIKVINTSSSLSNPEVYGNATISTPSGNTVLSIERQIAAISSFFVWGEFMMLLGRFPELGTFILVFTGVAKSIITFLLAFLSLLIGFSVSFHVLFQQIPVFETYQLSFVKVLMMMTGEIAYSEFILGQEMPLLALIFLTMVLFMVPILMANLLIGFAVADIPNLRREGKIKRLVKEASYLVGYETFILYTLDTKFFPKRLHHHLTSKCRINNEITIKPNHIYKNRRAKHRIPRDTVQEAIALAKCESPMEEFSHHIDDIETIFKTFQVQYIKNHRHLERKLQRLTDTCNAMKMQVDQLQTTTKKKTGNDMGGTSSSGWKDKKKVFQRF